MRSKLEGRYEVVEAQLPVLFTVVREINRYPTVPMRLSVEDMEVPVWDNNGLPLDVETVGLKNSST